MSQQWKAGRESEHLQPKTPTPVKKIIIHFREKYFKQNMTIILPEDVFILEDFLSPKNKTSYRK